MQQEKELFEIIYIASANRSGSTLLEHLLGSQDIVVNCGEFRRIGDFYSENKQAIRDPQNTTACTCGEKVSHCDFWSKVQSESGLDFSKDKFTSQVNAINRLLFKIVFFLFGPRLTRKIANFYPPFVLEMKSAKNCFRVFSAIHKLSKAKYIIDSSKMIYHFLLLKTAYPERIKLISLIRDGRAVSMSSIRGDRITFFMGGRFADGINVQSIRQRAFRAAVKSWVSITIQTLIFFYRQPSTERFFIQYEKLVTDLNEAFEEINSHLFNSELKAEQKLSTEVSHAIGGSPSRFKSDFSDIKIDDSWRKDWTVNHKKAFRFFAATLNRLLGYRQ
jgi:hypothetical protein